MGGGRREFQSRLECPGVCEISTESPVSPKVGLGIAKAPFYLKTDNEQNLHFHNTSDKLPSMCMLIFKAPNVYHVFFHYVYNMYFFAGEEKEARSDGVYQAASN